MKIQVVAICGFALATIFVGPSLAAEPTPEDRQVRLGSPDFSALILESPLISKLGDGESVTMIITTRGFFGGSKYALQFAGPPPVRVTVRGGNRPDAEDPLPFVGQVNLSDLDARKVDRTIAYYRSGPRGGCTTSSGITAAWQLKSGTKSESWVDASCAVVGSEPVLSLDSIVQRAAAQTP